MLSLEYLLISAVLAGMLALMLPLTSTAFELSSYAIDVSNANNLAIQLENCFNKLSVFSQGSNCLVEFKQKSSALVSIENNIIAINISNSKLNQSKSIEKSFDGTANFFHDFPDQNTQKTFSLMLVKNENEIKLELNEINAN